MFEFRKILGTIPIDQFDFQQNPRTNDAVFRNLNETICAFFLMNSQSTASYLIPYFSYTEINLFSHLRYFEKKNTFFCTKSFCLNTCFVETISFSSASRHVREKKIYDVRCAIFLWYTHCKHLYCRRSSSLESRIIETKINRANQNISNEFVN